MTERLESSKWSLCFCTGCNKTYAYLGLDKTGKYTASYEGTHTVIHKREKSGEDSETTCPLCYYITKGNATKYADAAIRYRDVFCATRSGSIVDGKYECSINLDEWSTRSVALLSKMVKNIAKYAENLDNNVQLSSKEKSLPFVHSRVILNNICNLEFYDSITGDRVLVNKDKIMLSVCGKATMGEGAEGKLVCKINVRNHGTSDNEKLQWMHESTQNALFVKDMLTTDIIGGSTFKLAIPYIDHFYRIIEPILSDAIKAQEIENITQCFVEMC